jgi:hypothetical protein
MCESMGEGDQTGREHCERKAVETSSEVEPGQEGEPGQTRGVETEPGQILSQSQPSHRDSAAMTDEQIMSHIRRLARTTRRHCRQRAQEGV